MVVKALDGPEDLKGGIGRQGWFPKEASLFSAAFYSNN
jgi:hypothetical protein